MQKQEWLWVWQELSIDVMLSVSVSMSHLSSGLGLWFSQNRSKRHLQDFKVGRTRIICNWICYLVNILMWEIDVHGDDAHILRPGVASVSVEMVVGSWHVGVAWVRRTVILTPALTPSSDTDCLGQCWLSSLSHCLEQSLLLPVIASHTSHMEKLVFQWGRKHFDIHLTAILRCGGRIILETDPTNRHKIHLNMHGLLSYCLYVGNHYVE